MAGRRPVAVLGAGSWGTALASVLARGGYPVLLWGRSPQDLADVFVRRCHRLLPDIILPEGIRVTTDLEQAVAESGEILIVAPSHAFTRLIARIHATRHAPHGIVWATKGLEPGRARLLHECVRETFGPSTAMAVLSGPSFAAEVARGLPTAITLAASCPDFAARLSSVLHSPHFRVYTSGDIIGVQLGGAVKNVIAIAAGVADGLGFGANARAALITRGLHEMTRLGTALGGAPETLAGLAGLGDLVLTCTDDQSRNRRFGLGIGRGEAREAVVRGIGQEIEGIAAAADARLLAGRMGVEMPICEQVWRLLHEELAPRTAVQNLLFREPKAEGCA